MADWQIKYHILSHMVVSLSHGQHLKFWQRMSHVVVALDVLAGFYIKHCPGIMHVVARPFFITSERKIRHNVLSHYSAMPVVRVRGRQRLSSLWCFFRPKWHFVMRAPYKIFMPSYGAGHLVTTTFGQWPIWPGQEKLLLY